MLRRRVGGMRSSPLRKRAVGPLRTTGATVRPDTHGSAPAAQCGTVKGRNSLVRLVSFAQRVPRAAGCDPRQTLPRRPVNSGPHAAPAVCPQCCGCLWLPPQLFEGVIPFTISTQYLDDTVLLMACGEIDRACEPVCDDVLASLPATLSSVVLDMQKVPFMDVTGLHFLCALHRHTARHRIQLHTRGWRAQPRYVLDSALHLDLQGADLNIAVRAALDLL
ncbi:STAS domain-containing protein [Streptomyces caniferus]|uniref:STAS domain-containing protein n=2 Tax=Streptomyces caniferus TaxID=285557 RepID=UPI0034563F78